MGGLIGRRAAYLTLLVADALVMLGGVVAIVRQGGDNIPMARRSTAQGRAELRLLEKDPVLDVRVPATRVRSTFELPGGRDAWDAMQSTEIRRVFDLTGDPGPTVEAYRAPPRLPAGSSGRSSARPHSDRPACGS